MAENLGSVYAEFRLAISNLRADVARANGMVNQLSNNVNRQLGQAGNNVSRNWNKIGTTVATAGKAVSGFGATSLTGIGIAVKTAADFQSQMSRVKAISGASDAEFKQLNETAKYLGATTAFSAKQAGEGMEYLALAGWKTSDIIKAMPGMLDLAAAGNLELGRAADIVSDTMSAFGIEASQAGHAADVFAYAQANANTNVEQMGEAMKYAAPATNSLGWSLEDTAAAMMSLANSGLKGSIAGQAFSSSLTRLTKPTKAMSRVMEDLNLEFFNAKGEMKSMPEVVAELEKGTKGLTQEQRAAAITTLFGAEAYKHWAILLQDGSKNLQGYSDALKNSDGTAKDMAATMLDNLNGAIIMVKSALEGLAIALGEVLLPYLQSAAEKFAGFVSWLTQLPGPIKEFVMIGGTLVALLAAIVGPIMILVGMALPGLITAFTFVSGTVLPAVVAAAGPVIGIITVIAGLAALIYAAWQTNFGGFRDFVIQVWNAVVQKFNEVKEAVMPIISDLVSYIQERWKAIQPVVETVMNAFQQVVAFVLPFVYDTVMFYLNAAKDVFVGVFNLIAGVIKFFVALFTGDWKGMWEAVKQMLSGAVQAVWGLFRLWFIGKIVGIIGKFIGKGISLFTQFVGKVIGKITSWVSNMVSKFTSLVSKGVTKFSELRSKVVQFIVKMVTNAINKVRDFATKFVEKIKSAKDKVVEKFKDMAQQIPEKLRSIISTVTTVGVDIVKGIWSGIKSMAGWLGEKLIGFAKSAIPGPIAKALGIKSPSRVLAKAVGVHLPTGIAMGAEDVADKTFDDMSRNLSKRLTGAMQMRMDAKKIQADMELSPSVNNEQRVIQGTGTNIVNYFTGPLIGSATVRSEQDIRAISQGLYKRIYGKNKAQGSVVPV